MRRLVIDRLKCCTAAMCIVVTAVVSSCGSSDTSVASDKEALDLVLSAQGRRDASSKGANSVAVCDEAAPSDYGRDSLCADSGFRSADRFSFANWADEKYTGDQLTAAQLVSLFGKYVCASITGDACTLSTGGEELLKNMEKAYLSGRCEGMVVLASLLKSKAVPLSSFAGKAASVINLDPDDEALQKSIAYWWMTQYSVAVAETSSKVRSRGLKEIIRLLEVNLSSGTFATMGLYFGGQGHALLPVGLLRSPDGIFHVAVYDSNLPEEFGSVDIDLAADKWTYLRGGLNGDAKLGIWSGTSGSIDLTAMSSRSETSSCPFCKGKDPGTTSVRLDDYVVPGRDRIVATYGK